MEILDGLTISVFDPETIRFIYLRKEDDDQLVFSVITPNDWFEQTFSEKDLTKWRSKLKTLREITEDVANSLYLGHVGIIEDTRDCTVILNETSEPFQLKLPLVPQNVGQKKRTEWIYRLVEVVKHTGGRLGTQDVSTAKEKVLLKKVEELEDKLHQMSKTSNQAFPAGIRNSDEDLTGQNSSKPVRFRGNLVTPWARKNERRGTEFED